MKQLGLLLAATALLATSTSPETTSKPLSLSRWSLHPESMRIFNFPFPVPATWPSYISTRAFSSMSAFAKLDAARSFMPHSRTTGLPICYWERWASVVSMALMTTAEAPRAYRALQQALAHIDQASDKEADMIRALESRYIADYDPAERREQDEAYAAAMAELAEQYPDDLDIRTLYAEALFLLEERRGYRSLEDPNVIRLHNVLLGVLAEDIRHPGACHLFVHATESTPTPELAAPCARYLGRSIPGASHINHMPSHTWNEMGLWHDAVRSNIEAWNSDQKAAFGKGFTIYPTHNLTMLYYAASMGGESAAAVQAAKDLAKLNGNTAMWSMALVRFGRFDEVLELEQAPNGEVNQAMFDFSKGYAALKTGDVERAEATQQALAELTETTTARFRFHDGSDIIGTLAAILAGEIAWTNGNLEAAAAEFRRATEYL
ncbi:MAG: hypothetical protein ACE37N_01830 [Pseudohongiellaceae bacterium]